MPQPCSQCGAANEPEATICASCGAMLGYPDHTQQGTPSETSSALREPAHPEAALASPPRKKPPARLVMLTAVCIVLLVALAGVGLWLYSRAHTTAPSRPPLYASSLTQNERSWQCEAGATCQFEANGLHILAPTDHLYFSFLSGLQFSEQVIDVKATLDNGDPQFVGVAIAFRSVGINGYGWLVFANGTYELVKWDNAGIATILIPLTLSSAIHTGLNQFNQLKVIAKGDAMTLFVNGQQLQQISDSTYASGGVALGAARFNADAVFSNLTVSRP